MGFTTWRLERRLQKCDKTLAKIHAKMNRLKEQHHLGRLTKAQLTKKMQTLESDAREQHGTMSTIMGNLRKARNADKRSAAQ